jgi:bZIP-type transcription factor MBZ1
MSHLSTTLDPEFDSFLNLDNDFTPASATATPHTAVPTLAHQSSYGSQQQTFSGPSFQYDAYRQQTGLPVGGLANTFAVNQNSGLNHFNGTGFVMPDEISNFPLTKIEDFDFARNSSFDMGDMDLEEDSPADVPTMFFPNGSSSKDYVSPTNLVSTAPVPRIYPGMHSQQAAQKAQAAQQKQQEIIRQQQQQQQAPRPIPGQKPLPKGPATKDPAVEESISRILSQMRQKKEVGDEEAGDSPLDAVSTSRTKKEEDDMDEDERLLNSEEGKKLSSKERRQLRNKVSARAFRSRRKGKSIRFRRHHHLSLTFVRIYRPTRRRCCRQSR